MPPGVMAPDAHKPGLAAKIAAVAAVIAATGGLVDTVLLFGTKVQPMTCTIAAYVKVPLPWCTQSEMDRQLGIINEKDR